MGTDGVRLSWNNLAWVTTYRIYRGVTSVPSSATQLAEIVNTGNCTYLDESGVVGTTYWYWIEAEGVEIFYSISGSAPRPSDKFKYSGPFTVTDTTTIIAFARKDGVLSSSKTVTIRRKSLTLAEAAGDASLVFTTGGDDAWKPIGDSTSSSGLSVQSDAITDKGSTWIKLTVSGARKLAFRWKVDCEYDYVPGLATWDHLKVVVDDVEVARIDGATNWKEHSIVFEMAGTHTVLWEFCKDDYNEEEYTDLAWISGVTWTPIAVIDPIPELSLTATAAEVALALEGSADAKLADNIKTAAEYSAYRTWALGLTGVMPDAVKSSPFAWLSYALDTDTLITADLKKGDVVIDTFESTATEVAFEFTVKIDGIKVGDDALEANIRKVFGIEGAAELSSDGTLNSGFSSNNVEVNILTSC